MISKFLKHQFTKRYFSTTIAKVKTSYGNLSDADRIFTNVYRDGDPFIEGAMKRVNFNKIG